MLIVLKIFGLMNHLSFVTIFAAADERQLREEFRWIPQPISMVKLFQFRTAFFLLLFIDN